MIALFIILGVMLYLTSAGFAGQYLSTRSLLRCKYNYCSTHHWHGGGYFIGLVWPIAFPYMYAASRAVSLAEAHEKGISREERKYQKELRAAQHRQDILAIREKEIKRLEHEAGIK